MREACCGMHSVLTRFKCVNPCPKVGYAEAVSSVQRNKKHDDTMEYMTDSISLYSDLGGIAAGVVCDTCIGAGHSHIALYFQRSGCIVDGPQEIHLVGLSNYAPLGSHRILWGPEGLTGT